MWGAIIGDIVGSRFEFANTFDKDFKLFTKECDFTDDTICTVAIADCLLNNSDFYAYYLRKWCRRYPNPMGCYGYRFAQWLESNNAKPYNSYGNGSAMRVSSIGMLLSTLDQVDLEAMKSAECTHNHSEGIKGAKSVAEAIFVARRARSVQEKKNAVHSIADFYYNGYLEKPYIRGAFDETCQGTVPVCFKIIQESDGFEDAIRNAISFGGDSDTIGAIVGSIAEVVFGIPDSIKKRAEKYLPIDMLSVVREFYRRIN